jgi:hypothetical protein
MVGATAWRLSTPGIARIPIRGLSPGDRLISIRVRGDAANEPACAIYTQSAGLAAVVPHTGANGIVASNYVDLLVDSPVAVVSAGQIFWLHVTSGGSTFDIWEIHVTKDHP